MEKRDIIARAKVTKVTWSKGQGGSRLFLGGKAVLGEGCRASCDSSRDACFLGKEKWAATKWAALLRLTRKLTSAGRDLCHGRDPGSGPSAPRGGPYHCDGDLCPHCGPEQCGDQRGCFSSDRQRHGHSARSSQCGYRGTVDHCGSALHSRVATPNIPAGAHGSAGCTPHSCTAARQATLGNTDRCIRSSRRNRHMHMDHFDTGALRNLWPKWSPQPKLKLRVLKIGA